MYRLPDELRPLLQQAFGPVVGTDELLAGLPPRATVVAIGDIVAKTLLEAGRRPKIIIVDFRTQRGPIDASLRELFGRFGERVARIKNPAGTVTDELVTAVKAALSDGRTTRIEIDGEEDLAGLPVFANAKNGTIVLYGMPNRGVVRSVVDGATRAQANDLLQKMRTG